jgi:glycosyltransferase involved in cell wall biosynthesis
VSAILLGSPIVKLTFVHYALARGGGMERYLADVLRGFADTGVETRVVVGRAEPRIAGELGAEVVELPCAFKPRLAAKLVFYLRVRRWLREHAGEPTLGLARVPGVQVMVCGGTHRGYLRACGRRRGLADRLELHMERRAYAAARLIVAHSEMMLRELRELYDIPAGKLVRLYPPVDTQRFRRFSADERAALRRRFGFDDRRARLLFPSGSHRRKGLDLLVAAVAQLPQGDCEIIVAGSKPPSGLAGAVRHVGRIEAMEELYAACDATVLPSRYEPFGLVYVESVLCGTPAVLPGTAGAAEILAGPGAVVLPSLQPAAIAAGIREALQAGPAPVTSVVTDHGLSVEAHVRRLRALFPSEDGANG